MAVFFFLFTLLMIWVARQSVQKVLGHGPYVTTTSSHFILYVMPDKKVDIRWEDIFDYLFYEIKGNEFLGLKLAGKRFWGKMIFHAIEQARSKAYITIEAGTGNSSLPQLALYQKCGFRMTGVDSGFFIRHYEEEIWGNGIHCRDMVRLEMDLS